MSYRCQEVFLISTSGCNAIGRELLEWRRRRGARVRTTHILAAMPRFLFALLAFVLSARATTGPRYDTVIRNVAIYDGGGGAARHGDVAIAITRRVMRSPMQPRAR